VKFGGPDTRSLRWLDSNEASIDLGARLNGDSRMRAIAFIRKEYLEKGAALFGRETPESLQDFRDAVGGALDEADDEETVAILEWAVQQTRNLARLDSWRSARIYDRLLLISMNDEQSCRACKMTHGLLLFLKRLDARDVPPFHRRCRCRLEVIIPGAGWPKI
jgi:hypothetical protein